MPDAAPIFSVEGIVVGALLLDFCFGDPRNLPHPVVYIGKLISLLEQVLRRVTVTGKAGGVILLTATVFLTVFAAEGVIGGLCIIHPWLGAAVGMYVGWTCLAARSLHRESKKVADALTAGDLPEARRQLSFIVGRDTDRLEEPDIWRAVVETVAENTSDGVIAPLLYLILGGPVLALAYKAVNTLDSMVGYKNDRYLHFGWASARFDDLANLVPARLTALLMVLAAPAVGLSARGAFSMMLRDGRNHSSPNSGFPEAAAAGALGVQLGGTNFYFGRPVAKPTIGEPVRALDRSSWRGAVRLMYGTEVLLVVLWVIVTVLVPVGR